MLPRNIAMPLRSAVPPELDSLRLFLNVAATGSFSRAAALASTTQSAVSKRISALESDLGARLFQRTGRGAALTDAGRALVPRAEALAAEVAGLADAVRDARDAPRGLVRLAVQPSVGWPLVGDLVEVARERHPGIRLQIAEGTTRQIEEWLAEGRIDVGVMSSEPPATHAESGPLFTVPLLLVAAAGDPLTRASSVPFARLAHLPLVIATLPNGGRVLLEERAREHGVALDVVLEVNSIHLIKRLVARGGLYTIASPPSVRAEIAARDLSAVRIVRPQMVQAFHLALGGRRHPGAAVRAVTDLVRRLARGDAAGARR